MNAVYIVAPYQHVQHLTHAKEARVEEAKELVRALGQDLLGIKIINLRQPNSNSFIGAGHLNEIKQELLRLAPPLYPNTQKPEVDFVYVDSALTAVQQRNIEKALGCYVEDREGLILNIFSARAKTEEGRLQVKLARLQYDQSRLVRSWTHLERQRGSTGNIGGPGERQIELDRRQLAVEIKKLTDRLNKLRQTRLIHRKTRQKVPYPIVALVGYTNAGKSTLFNYLTGEKDLAMNLLFATLDTHMRKITLPSGREIILSDTVGFIADLPTHLIAAFRATLEELSEAAIILHVVDLAAGNVRFHQQQVNKILSGLNLPEGQKHLLIGNKIDLLHQNLESSNLESPNIVIANSFLTDVSISAKNGTHIAELLQTIDKALDTALDQQYQLFTEIYEMPANEVLLPSLLYKRGKVITDVIADRPPHHRRITVRISHSAVREISGKLQISPLIQTAVS